MKRVLVIRGGAIGDFVLTLPAIKLLRDEFPAAHLEILGYKRIVALAENGGYVNATRSLESAVFARFFAKGAELPEEPSSYFRSFDLIVSYLFDPDRIFETNVTRAGGENFVAASPIIRSGEHAARQLAQPLEKIGLRLTDNASQIFPSQQDRDFADDFLRGLTSPIVALHPGSGSETKNWPLENWIELQAGLLPLVLLVGGEADRARLEILGRQRIPARVRFAINLSLPHVAALLEKCAVFVGHDSGISHIAAAVGTKSILLFGNTNPQIWAPANAQARVLRAPNQELSAIRVEDVAKEIANLTN